MKTPVIIAAHNEEERISDTLRSLPADRTEPIVAVNGSTDATAEIARSFGVTVLEFEEQGKLPAIQHALSSLGQRALEPLMILDADTVPVNPIKWHRIMTKQLNARGDVPMMTSGPVWFTSEKGARVGPAARSLFRIAQAAATRSVAEDTGLKGGQYGPNQGMRIERPEVLDAVMALEHFWPMGDVALTEAVADTEGGSFVQLVHKDALAYTPESASYPPLSYYLKNGMKKAVEATVQSYVDRGATGSKPYSPKKTK